MKTVASLLVATYCAISFAGIYSANDCKMFDSRYCYIDIGGTKTVFPKRSPKSVCLQDPVWLHEAILERKLAIQCVNSFPNQFTWTKSGLLINENEFPYPLSIVERVDYRMLYPSGRLEQICNPSKTMDGTASYIATPYSDVSQFAVDKWDSTVFHEQGGFIDAGFVSNKIDRAQMQAWFDNIMKARSFTRYGSRGSDKVTYVTLDAPQSNVDIELSGNVKPPSSFGGWYGIGQNGYPWWEYESETSFDLKYSWKWNSMERRAGSGKDYTFYNVPPDATVELGVIVECINWSSYKVDQIKDETLGYLLTYEYYGKQISYTNRVQRFWIVGSKKNYGNTVANLSFSSDEISVVVARTASLATSMCTGCNPSEGVPEGQATKTPNDVHPAFPCSGYPKKEMRAMFNVYFFPRITLGDHTKWWN